MTQHDRRVTTSTQTAQRARLATQIDAQLDQCARLADGPTAGLIGWWKLDETSGTTAVDSAGSSNGTMLGSLGGSTNSVTGAIGKALNMSGNAISLGRGIDLANSSFTVSGRLQRDGPAVNYDAIFGSGDGNALLAAQARQDDPDLLLGRVVFARLALQEPSTQDEADAHSVEVLPL